MPIRNFPHQVNRVEKLHAALTCIADLIDRGHDALDDGILGYELARRRIYTFRGLDPFASGKLIEQRIYLERKKSASSQGPRTFARDLRRTLYLLGFVGRSNGALALTSGGSRLLQLDASLNGEEYIALWRDAVLAIEMNGEAARSHTIHPAKIILKLIERLPNVEKRWLALVFAIQEDTKSEVERVVRQIEGGNFVQALRDIGATEYQAANAVKILPSLLEQVRLIRIRRGRCKLLTVGKELARGNRQLVFIKEAKPGKVRMGRTLKTISLHKLLIARAPTSVSGHKILSAAEQIAMIEKREKRTHEHHAILKFLSQKLDPKKVQDLQSTEDSFDLVAKYRSGKGILLFEAKTITADDVLSQTRTALGQLLFYEFFDVRPNLSRNAEVHRIVVFNREPGPEARDFLGANDTFVIAFIEGSLLIPQIFRHFFKKMI